MRLDTGSEPGILRAPLRLGSLSATMFAALAGARMKPSRRRRHPSEATPPAQSTQQEGVESVKVAR